MGKKNLTADKHKSNKNKNTKNNSKRTIMKRRNIKNKDAHEHWKFKNTHKNAKFEKKQKKIINEELNKKTQIQRDEDDIKFIENEKNLFDGKGYYFPQEENIDDKNLIIDWEDNDNTNNDIETANQEIITKMNEVTEKKLEPKVVMAYKQAGEILKDYSSGKLPKVLSILPAVENWEELLNITCPDTWTPRAMYELTILFSSNLGPALAYVFYEKYLLPAIRLDIKKNKKLNCHYYESLKKSLFKPAAFFKGIILPMSKNLNSKEAAIIGSILKKCSIPFNHSSAALTQLMKLCKEGKNGMSVGAIYFMRILLLKKYAMPQIVKEQFVEFFCSYEKFKEHIPVMWYQLLLIFVQVYKLDLNEKEKLRLKNLNKNISHHLISTEIAKELSFNSNYNNNNENNKNKMDIE